MTQNTIHRGRLFVILMCACALAIVAMLWVRAQTINETTGRICDKVDALTAALVRASAEVRGHPPTDEERARLEHFITNAACDPEHLKPLLKGERP